MPLKLLQVGLGPLGVKMIQFALARPTAFEVVGAVDIDPNKIGKDVGDVAAAGKLLGIRVQASVGDVVKAARPDVAVLTTVSDLARITPQVEAIVGAGLPVVSTCEELSFPWQTSPELAKRIDSAAKGKNVAVLGTGVNPGYLMDFLPTTLTAVCQRVDRVKVSRVQDATFRRVPFQQKIGAGLTLEQFEAKKKTGTLRHVGLTESIHLIASRMGWGLDSTTDELSPIVAERDIKTEAMSIKRGMAAGVQQIGRGVVKGEEKITLVFRAAIGEAGSHDTVEITGEPNLKSTIPGGVNGDVATCAITLNACKQIGRAGPGLVTMVDMPVPSYFQ